jgi:Transposase DDE domain group 1
LLTTECIQSEFEFEGHLSRSVVARFDGGTMTSDGGALLLRRTDGRLHLLRRLAACFHDRRDPCYITHRVEELVAQRVYGLALGYEDLSDHDQLRHDPLLAVLSGKPGAGQEPLAGKSTLNRLELSTEKADRYKKIECQTEALDALLVQVFIEAYARAPERIILDLDVTDLALHGHQEGRFFHGYYDSYCYLPLYVFCGEHLLCARLRTADQDASAGSKTEVERIVEQIRRVWPELEIILRADSGFCREELMAWCEEYGVHYVFGFARNERLRRLLGNEMEQAQRQYETCKETGTCIYGIPL